MENKKIRYLSVCSGMEAATVAWHHMGWTPVGFSEIEPFPSQILKHHYPTIPNYGDLTKFKEWPIERGAVDLLVGGTPCTAFSVAGLRKGLDDPRGHLSLTFLALADHLRPKYILWENVPGVLSSSKGEDFASFISALAELGYGFAWRVCDAQYFGVPQRRKRVFLLAIEGAGNWRTAAEILFERKSLCGDIEESDQEGESVASDAGASVETSGKGVAFRKSKRATSTTDNETWVMADSSNTLNNFDLGDTRTTHAVVGHGAPAMISAMAVRRLTPVECERLQGFPDNYSQIPWKGKSASECPDGPRYKACGNSMAVPVMRWIGERIQKQIDGTL
jgi:DNA (cytosine-5)-methyltransferase 1